MCEVAGLASAFRYLTGESGTICRLCFDTVDSGGVSLDTSRVIECFYYDDTVTYAKMLTDLGAPSDLTLPRLLCECCADLTMKAFFFQKLSQYSNNKWNDAIERLEQSVKSADSIVHGVKTAYFLILKESTRVITGRKALDEITKKAAIGKITKSIRRSKNYESKVKYKFIICQHCGEKIKRRYLSAHLKRKHNRKEYQCPKCEKIFRDEISMRIHEERIHAPKTIQCPCCDKKFSTERTLRYHNTKHHTPGKCKNCLEEFPSKEALHRHPCMNDMLQCPRCYKTYQGRAALLRHSKRCRDDRERFICDFCSISCCSKRSLVGHLITLHGFGSIHTCKWCKKSFDAASKLKVHEVKHTRERRFKCTLCERVFVTKAALMYHTRIHTGEKPFSCEECGDKFLSASRRMDHMRRKHLEPQHECSVCGSKFYSKFCLRKHMPRHKNPQSKLFTKSTQIL